VRVEVADLSRDAHTRRAPPGRSLLPQDQQHHQDSEGQHNGELNCAGHEVIVGQVIGWVLVVTFARGRVGNMPGEDADDRPADEVAAAMRALLTAIDEGLMSCSQGYRSRLQGAVMALETQTGNTRNVAERPQTGARWSHG
jgi:hypothetical protein